jgi:4-hydroxybenzoate polyprenyltransferase
MKNEFGLPSFYLHQMNAFLILVSLFLLFTNYSKIKKIEPYQSVVLSLLFSLAVGVHGLSHLGAEYIYGYNPIRNMLLV